MYIYLNDKQVEVHQNETILEVCNRIGLFIPTLCYDKRLVSHGACRMCIVEVKGMKGLKAACSTPVIDGMEVMTHTDRVEKARKDILRLLWSTHRNDCLTCTQNGNCQLQELCFIYDIDTEDKYFSKRLSHYVDESNPFYTFDRDKCILCGKCVRICSELQMTTAIGYSERGYLTHVTHPFEMGMEHSDCVSCGNCLSVCPTGAISEKTFDRFRQWDLKYTKTTCGYCGVGCQIELVTHNGKVVGVRPAVGLNEGLLCVKGKFAHHFIHHPDRLTTPLIRRDGELVPCSWDEALDVIANKIIHYKFAYGADSIAGMASARCTSEDNYMMQKFFRTVIGTNSVDHCARL